MPLNDFYTYKITSSESDKLIAEILIAQNHAVFDGHFPEQPVTPGVILVEIARFILSEQVGKQLMLTSGRELKFMSPVIPKINPQITLNIEFNLVDNNYKANCLFTSGEKTFTKLKGIFSAS